MPVQGAGFPELQPGFATLPMHIQSVRLFTRDFAHINLLIRGEESDDRMIAWATLDFLSDFNATPHFTALTLDDLILGYGASSFCVRGTVCALLESLMLLYSRNHLPLSDGGNSMTINDKAPMIQAMLSTLRSAYEQNKSRMKVAMNVNSILDVGPSGVHSDYFALNIAGYN